MTEKLYELDAYLSEFEATVTDCISDTDKFKIVLDKTAFFPQGGGQAADIGTIDDIKVFDVQENGGAIYHYTEKPLKLGSRVIAKLDFDRRFNFMQNHTGEHIVSGISHKLYGVNNVGFHLGENLVTLDFDKELSREQLDKVEYLANQTVWADMPVITYYPTADELKKIDYRSKKEIDGAVRLVKIENTDICACCAPHVKATGEIGLIKLLDTERMRGGIRIILKCGKFALQDYKSKFENVSKIASRLSAKQENCSDAVALLEQKLTDEIGKSNILKRKITELLVDTVNSEQNCVFLDDCDMKDLQLVADKLHKKFGGIKGAFSGADGNYNFAICGGDDLDEFFKDFKSKLTVRGGGRNGMVQGSAAADKQQIKLFF